MEEEKVRIYLLSKDLRFLRKYFQILAFDCDLHLFVVAKKDAILVFDEQEEIRRFYEDANSPKLVKICKNVLVVAFSSGLLGLVKNVADENRNLEYFDVFSTLSITEILMAPDDESFYVGTKIGLVSKFDHKVSKL